jgi:hypothetical protein
MASGYFRTLATLVAIATVVAIALSLVWRVRYIFTFVLRRSCSSVTS